MTAALFLEWVVWVGVKRQPSAHMTYWGKVTPSE